GGLFMSTTHLGKPMRFYRGFNNLAHSPVAREALGVALYFAGLVAYTGLKVANLYLEWGFVSFLMNLAGVLAVISIGGGMYYMYKSYQIKARPFWNHHQVGNTFVGSMFSLGAVVLGLIAIPVLSVMGETWGSVLVVASITLFIGLAVEGVGLISHAHYLNTEEGEGAAAHYIQCTTFGNTYYARNISIVVASILALIAVFVSESSLPLAIFAFLIAACLALGSSLVGRALFYVLVIPTTMPGAFFWKNKSFEEHARDIGLADMPQVGVVPDLH
ncbi:MAG: dimethyl sulfoxide reductase anchor subunit, partial [Gammaproteobacteria bacterium]|nr:dimethyl sulfoxide reductase anchor subunit [Gammaproteobacteria bacterium]